MRSIVKPLALLVFAWVTITNDARADQENGGDELQKSLVAIQAAREAFLNGDFLREEKLALRDLFIAEQSHESASTAHDSAKRLAQKNIITAVQVEAAALAAQNSSALLDAAKAKLNSLREAKVRILQGFDRLEQEIRKIKAK